MERIKDINNLLLKDMLFNFSLYEALPDVLIDFPLPDYLNISGKTIPIPTSAGEFMNSLCYGQRLFLTRETKNDIDIIIRVIDGYYYPLYTGKKWDEDKALLFGKKVINCKAKELYPIAMQLVTFVSEMAEREKKLLYREPSQIEKAAGIEKLNVFSDLTSLDFLRDCMKITVPEVLLTPYNECLVRFMIAKETQQYQERYIELSREESKKKKHG